ncbi:MAG: exo-alpha-sialidase [Planctomycetes bacterium]|nr:exo-alpha-sialidase [Planctomycetota bacterium]
MTRDHLPKHDQHVVLLAFVVAVLFSAGVHGQDAANFIEVRNPKKLSVNKIPCERISLGKVDDYKPTIALLPSGELLLSMFSGRRLDNGKIAEQTVLYRSADGGRTWSEREEPDIAGREPALSVTRSGTVLLTTHLTGPDVRNEDGYTHSYLHRSEDGGRMWTSTRVEPKEFRPRTKGLMTRNVLQLADGTLILGVSEHIIKNCKSFVWRSRDDGKTWNERFEATFDSVPKDYPYTLFGEAHLWQVRSGRLYAILRVGAGNTWPLSGTTDPGNNDQSERMIVYTSKDLGRKWSKVDDLGGYGQMYMSLLDVGKDRLLLTFTQRAIEPPLGVRAVLGRQTTDGFEFDMKHDQIMLDTKTPRGIASGGGFGPTVRLASGTLVTSYTYRDAKNLKHAEVVRWRLPE